MLEKAKAVFDRALMPEVQLSERLDLVRRECGADQELFKLVMDLLAAHESHPEPSISGGTEAFLGGPEIPEKLGQYRILGKLGGGGMGVVYEAEQDSPRRHVALKVIKPSAMSERLLQRFEVESEILGKLQHPGIAQVYEARTFATPLGRQPYFAMELIRGRPLNGYAEEHKLSTRARLELLIKICQAVQHAHGRGVIHRDLKPDNILVDESGQPKILDFGVARATDADVKTTTLQTDVGQIIGTLSYMSPEQAGGDPTELDTRSDVYALGVIAYELLASRLPYDLSKRALLEALRVIRYDEPNRLSTVSKTLRGDLEVIVGKALEKEKDRRYQTAAALAADIERYLKDEPIAARPPSSWYQLSKFSRRNKGLVGGVAASFFILLGGLGVSLYFFAQASLERDEKGKALDDLKKVSDFQESMLSQIDPTTAGVRLTEDVSRRFTAALEKTGVPEQESSAQADTFRQQWLKVNATDAALELIDATILRPAAKTIDVQFKNQPLVEAQLKQVLADRYGALGLYAKAMPLQESALMTRKLVLGDVHPDTLSSIAKMGYLLTSWGKLNEAEPYCREAMEDSRRVLGGAHLITLGSIGYMAALLHAQGKRVEAEVYYREAMVGCRQVLGEEHRDTLRSIDNLGFVLKDLNRFDQAEEYYREALEKRRRVLGDEDPDTLLSINNLGALLQARDKLDEAEACFRETLEKRRRVSGEQHPDTLACISNLGNLLLAQRKVVEAEAYIREAMDMYRRVLGEEHPTTLVAIGNMGSLLQAQSKLGEAEPYYREVLEKSRRVLGEEHPNTLIAINNLGNCLRAQGRLNDAEPYLREALEKRRRVLGDEHLATLTSINNMTLLLQAQRRFSEAELLYREALEKSRRLRGEEHPNTLTYLGAIGYVLYAQGKLNESEPLFREVLKKSQRDFGENDPRTLTAINNLSAVLIAQDKFEEAETLLRELRKRSGLARGEDDADTLIAINSLSIVLEKQDKLEEAETLLRELRQRSGIVHGEDHPDTLTAISDLGALLEKQGKHTDAIEMLNAAEPASRRVFGGPNPPQLALLLRNLGRARTGVGEFGAADANLLEAHSIFATAGGETQKDTLSCVQALVDLHTAWDGAEPGKGHDATAAEWRSKLAMVESSSSPSTDKK